MLPREGLTMPKTVRSSVDLPAPLAPMIETISPAHTSTETPRSTSISPYPAWTSSSRRSGDRGGGTSRGGIVGAGLAPKVGLDDPGVAPDGFGGPFGDLLAVVEDDDALGDVHDHVHVVLDQQHGLALAVQAADLLLHLIDHRRVH